MPHSVHRICRFAGGLRARSAAAIAVTIKEVARSVGAIGERAAAMAPGPATVETVVIQYLTWFRWIAAFHVDAVTAFRVSVTFLYSNQKGQIINGWTCISIGTDGRGEAFKEALLCAVLW